MGVPSERDTIPATQQAAADAETIPATQQAAADVIWPRGSMSEGFRTEGVAMYICVWVSRARVQSLGSNGLGYRNQVKGLRAFPGSRTLSPKP